MDVKMIGTLSMGKETEKFKPFEDKVYDSGWERKVLKFNAICGDNRHMLVVTAGAWSDGHGDVYSFTKGTVNEDGTREKGESIKIPFKDRLDVKKNKINEIADFRKFVFDLEKPNRRQELLKLADKVKEGSTVTDEELKNVGLVSEDELTDAITKSNKLRHEFISEWDFVDFIKKVIESGKYNNTKFYIKSSGDYSYNQEKDTVYENLVPTKIYLADQNAEPYSTANIKLLFGSESLDTLSVDEKKRVYVNGWMMERENNLKKNIPVPVTISIVAPSDDADDKAKKLFNGIQRKFTVEGDAIKELGIEVELVNGAQREDIDIESLPDEIKDDIECGLVTLEEIQREMGQAYGENIREKKFVSIGRGYKGKGCADTSYTVDDMKITVEDATDDDLFDDEDDEI